MHGFPNISFPLYVFYSDKCSHGGPRDGSRVEGARGGINKDLPTACFSPHHHLHQQAAEMAVEVRNFFILSLIHSFI